MGVFVAEKTFSSTHVRGAMADSLGLLRGSPPCWKLQQARASVAFFLRRPEQSEAQPPGVHGRCPENSWVSSFSQSCRVVTGCPGRRLEAHGHLPRTGRGQPQSASCACLAPRRPTAQPRGPPSLEVKGPGVGR